VARRDTGAPGAGLAPGVLPFLAFNGINKLRAFNVILSSIPTAPTNFSGEISGHFLLAARLRSSWMRVWQGLDSLAARRRIRLLQVHQDAEGFVSAPAVDLEVLVEGQNICRSKLIRQTNQAGVSKIDSAVSILSQDLLYTSRLW